MTNKEIWEIAMQQSAYDNNCSPNDFSKSTNVVVVSKEHKKARRYLELPFEKRHLTWNYLCDHGYKEATIDRKWIHYCLDTKADTVIFPAQDLLCLTDKARINTPGTVGDPNWKWRLNKLDDLHQVLKQIKPQIIASQR